MYFCVTERGLFASLRHSSFLAPLPTHVIPFHSLQKIINECNFDESHIQSPITVLSGPINRVIPDDDAQGISYPINVLLPAGSPAIASIDVTFNIAHDRVNDLVINLQAPNKKVLNLAKQVGTSSSKDFVNTVVSSTASVPFTSETASFTGTFLPSAEIFGDLKSLPSTTKVFSDLFSPSDGPWTFAVADLKNGPKEGTLKDWAITFNFGTYVNPSSFLHERMREARKP